MNELILDALEVISPSKKRPFWKRLTSARNSALSASFKPGGIFEEKRGPWPYDRIPKVMYFYYLKFGDDGSLIAREYRYYNKIDPNTPDPDPNKSSNKDDFAPIKYSELGEKVAILVEKARKDNGTDPSSYSVGDFQDLIWRRRCYFVIFFDEDNWKLLRRKGDDNVDKSPVVFLTRKNYKGKMGNANHTFYDAKFDDITVKDSRGLDEDRSYFSFINYMKDDDSGQSEVGKNVEQYFSFNVLIEVSFEDKKTPPLLVIFDPGGTNLGPPLEP